MWGRDVRSEAVLNRLRVGGPGPGEHRRARLLTTLRGRLDTTPSANPRVRVALPRVCAKQIYRLDTEQDDTALYNMGGTANGTPLWSTVSLVTICTATPSINVISY